MMKTKVLYTATTDKAFKDLLSAIFSIIPGVDIRTDYQNLTILVEYDANDDQTANDLKEMTANIEAVAKEVPIEFMFTEDAANELIEAQSTMKKAYEEMKKLTNERDTAISDRDMYKQWFREERCKSDRVKDQIKAITSLLRAIYPEK